MPLVFGVLVAAAVIFAVFAVALGHGGSMTTFQPDWPGHPLPEDRPVRAADVAAARFSLAFRGYRMAEVDAALDRLAGEIATRDDTIEQLTGHPFENAPVNDAAPAPVNDAAPALVDDAAPAPVDDAAPGAKR